MIQRHRNQSKKLKKPSLREGHGRGGYVKNEMKTEQACSAR